MCALIIIGGVHGIPHAADNPIVSADISLQFTPEEQEWLRAHPVVRLGVYRAGWPPFDIITEQEQYRGISADYVYLLEKRLGFSTPVVVFDNWQQVLKNLETGQIDWVASITNRPQRQAHLSFSNSYLNVPTVSVRRKGWTGDAQNPALAGLRIAAEEGNVPLDQVKRLYPAAKFLLVADSLAALTAVAEGRADIYFGNLAVAGFLIDKHYLSHLAINTSAPLKPSEMRFGVRNDWPIFTALLNKGLEHISEEEHRKIRERWIPHSGDLLAPKLELNAEERQWLAQHPVIRVASGADYAPFSFRADGQYQGLAIDYLQLAAKQLGFTVEFVADLTRAEQLQQVRDKRIDLLTNVAKTPARGGYVNFTRPLLAMPAVIVTRSVHPIIQDLEELNGKSVALLKDFAVNEIMQYEHPQIVINTCTSALQCVDLVAQGKTTATIGDLSVLSPLLQARYAGQLKINSIVPAFDINQSFGVRKDWPELARLLDKALVHIKREDHDRIRQKWLSVQYRQGVEWRQILKIALPIALVVIIALAFIVLWNRKLQTEIGIRKRTEAALAIAKDQAEAATAAKSAFLASMSHEIRTPMNSIIGLVELLSRTQLEYDQRRNLSVIDDSAKTLLHVINDILDFSKIEAGGLALDPASVNLASLAESVMGIFEQLAQQKDLALALQIAPQLAKEHWADGLRIRQVLLNLIGNAIKFTRRGHVALNVQVLKDDEDQQHIRFEVVDTGIGISKANQAKLFQAFTQAEASTTRRFGGTGLGLAIARRLTDLMQGALSVESEIDRGTTMCFDITLRKTVAAIDCYPMSGKTAAVFMDVADVNAMVMHYLRAWGMVAIEPPPGAPSTAAIDLIVATQNHLILDSVDADLVSVPRIVLDTDRHGTTMDRGADKLRVSTNPLYPSVLLRAAEAALGIETLPEEAAKQLLAIPHFKPLSREQAKANGSLILVVDDHPTNRFVIQQQLSLLGYAAEVFDNAAEALSAWTTGDYGLVLTDCFMPGMDGYTLTRRIREQEQDRKLKRTPIIAFSAAVLSGEQEKSLAVGMDDFLPKPADLNAIARKLEAWLPQIRQRTDAENRIAQGFTPAKAPLEAIDVDVLRASFGDSETIKRILQSYFVSHCEDRAQLARAIEERDHGAVERIAHRMKGAARIVGAGPHAQWCSDMEKAGHGGDAARTEELWRRFAAIDNELKENIDAIASQSFAM